MKYFLYVISIPVLLCTFSCHRGTDGKVEPGVMDEGLAGKGTGEIIISMEQFKSMGMEIGDPSPMMFSNSIHANGHIIASRLGHAEISTLMSGRVKQIHHSVGDYVKQGEVLFSLESNEIILVQQEYAEAFHQLNLLKSDFERMKTLSKENVIAQKDFLKIESEFKSMQARSEGLRAQLRMIHIDPLEVEKGHIVPDISLRSPIHGSIIKQDLVLGQIVEPYETCMEVLDQKKLRLRLQVFDGSLAEIVTGQHVLYSTPDQPERKFTAVISHIGKSIDQDTKTVHCYAEIEFEEGMAFVKDLYVETEIITCEREAIAVPEDALIRETERDFGLVLVSMDEEKLRFRKIPIQTGVTSQGYTEVLDVGVKNLLLTGVYDLWTEE